MTFTADNQPKAFRPPPAALQILVYRKKRSAMAIWIAEVDATKRVVRVLNADWISSVVPTVRNASI